MFAAPGQVHQKEVLATTILREVLAINRVCQKQKSLFDVVNATNAGTTYAFCLEWDLQPEITMARLSVGYLFLCPAKADQTNLYLKTSNDKGVHPPQDDTP